MCRVGNIIECECDNCKKEYVCEQHGEYAVRVYCRDYAAAHYYRDGTFEVGMANANGSAQFICPCCGNGVEMTHRRGDYPCEFLVNHPIIAVSDVQNLDFGMLPQLLNDSGRTNEYSMPDDNDPSATFYRFDCKDTPECDEIFVVTKPMDGNSVVLSCTVSWKDLFLRPRFEYCVLICPNEPETVGVAWVEFAHEPTIPVRVFRARIPASQISKLPTFSI